MADAIKYCFYDPGNKLYYSPLSGHWQKKPGHLYESRAQAENFLRRLAGHKIACRTIEIHELHLIDLKVISSYQTDSHGFLRSND